MVAREGGDALAELLLDRAVETRVNASGLVIADAEILAEQQRMLENLSSDPEDAARLFAELRNRRGLSQARYDALLRRNAGLRRLVRDRVVVTEAAIQQAYALQYGDRYRVRLITADNPRTLGLAKTRVLGGESFTDLAIELSTDESASQGGLLSPINPADATYPKAIRDALPGLAMDRPASRISPVIALSDIYALLWLEGVVKQQGPPLDEVRGELEQVVRSELERLRMQQLARSILEQAEVVVLEPELEQDWQRQLRAIADSP